MAAFWLVTWVEVRARWRALASLALLPGLAGGVVLGAAAGARRTDTAYPRLLTWANASQLSVVPEGSGLNGYYAALARLPQAEAVAPGVLYNAALPPEYHQVPVVQAIASPDDSYGTTVDRVKLLAGTMFGSREPGAVVINKQLADVEHLSPGGTLRLNFIPVNPKTNSEDFSQAFIMSFTVTGIGVFDSQVVSNTVLASAPTALLSPPFAALHVRIGQDIRVVIDQSAVTGPPVRRTMRVVGEVILPGFSRGSFNPTDLGTGALLAASVLSEPQPGGPCTSGTCYNFLLLRYRPGTDKASAAATIPRWPPGPTARPAPAWSPTTSGRATSGTTRPSGTRRLSSARCSCSSRWARWRTCC